jgi:outer membrane protein assembly factor BamB
MTLRQEARLLLLFPVTCFVLVVLTGPSLARSASRQKESSQQVLSSAFVRWEGKPGVERYRLQLSTDATFADIVFDQPVVGNEYKIEAIPPGKYFWRVAPATKETGTFSPPKEIEVTVLKVAGRAAGSSKLVVAADKGGWRTATGEVLSLVTAHLRSAAIVDILAVNSVGTVYAIDSRNGVALWTARYRPDATAPGKGSAKVASLQPVAFGPRDGVDKVVVAFDAGVRALSGNTGREVWRAGLEGLPTSGVAGDLDADGVSEVIVATEEPNRLYVLEGKSGIVLANKSLDASIVGAPCFPSDGSHGIVLGLRNRTVELRGADGEIVRTMKVQTEITTAPIFVKNSEMPLIVIGSQQGLLVLSSADLKFSKVISIDGDAPFGTLSASDVDGDAAPEIAVVTKSGRMALVNAFDGKVRWYADGVNYGPVAAFADVNGDRILDVLVPGLVEFALGYDGRDGELIWKAEESGGTTRMREARARYLAIAPAGNGDGIMVGSDSARMGLRAVELPSGAVRAASK